ncbi:DUF4231 domain-containing protein [Amycolatopsis sp. cg5]|uniref:DUF4231 domain-containing protein n=1 Tax=Amycolatopsis sp. cg5 TaxID=3238802 RepID=UPI003523F6A1
MLFRRQSRPTPYWIHEPEPGREIPRSVLAKWEFYRTTSRKNCRRMHYCDLATLVLAAVGPAVTVIAHQPSAGALIGVAVVITSGARGIFRWDQNWISRARACYSIEHQVALYSVGAEPYDGEAARANLVRSVQAITDAEGQVWEGERRRSAAPQQR